MLNDFQTTIYNDLQHLVETNEAFFSKVQVLDDVKYQVYNYRLATHTDFLLPNARESRGIMFELDVDGNPVRLACFMPQKFFNLGESITTSLDLSDTNIDGVMDKLDGSIISTFIHKGKLRLKSKTSLHSEHVEVASAWLDKQQLFKTVLTHITKCGFSVHMELTSPLLRIVLGYNDVGLTILSIRDIATGEMINRRTLFGDKDSATRQLLLDHWVPDVQLPNVKTFIESVKDMTGIEGFVIRTKCGEHVKIKTDWYCALHHTKDSVSAPRRLFECIINEGVDDLKGMFAEDIVTMQRITEMETKVVATYNHIIATVESFHAIHKDLDRKGYAIAASKIEDGLMSLKMNLFLGRENNYKEFALKHIELFGINDAAVYETTEE